MSWRSVGAVAAGIATNFLAVPVDLVLHGLGVFPPVGQDMSDGLYEVDRFWKKLGQGGAPGRCGWLKDRYGLSWQVVPRALGECLNGPDRAGAQRAMEAMLKMGKLEVKALKAAYRGR